MDLHNVTYFVKRHQKKEMGTRKIENNLAYLAIQSENNYNNVIAELQRFVIDHQGKYKDVESLNFVIEKIKQQYRDNHDKKYSFKEAKNIYEEILA
jgi:aspartate oxidase